MSTGSKVAPLVVRMRFEIPREANVWLKNHNTNHNTTKGTREDWKQVIESLFTAFLEDIASDYEQREANHAS
jgi:hypothetical protein